MQKKIAQIALISSLMTLSFTALAEEGIVLRRALAEGQCDHYAQATSISIDADASSFGMDKLRIDIDTSMNMACSTGKVDQDNGLAELTIDVTDFKLAMQTPFGGDVPSRISDRYTVQGKINQMNQISDVKTTGISKQMADASLTQLISAFNALSFPEQQINVGDNWPIILPATSGLNSGSKLNAKLTSVKEVNGKQLCIISITGPVKVSFTPPSEGNSSINPMGIKIKIDATLDMDTIAEVEAETGRVQRIDAKSKIRGTGTPEGMDLKLPISGTSTMIMKLKA